MSRGVSLAGDIARGDEIRQSLESSKIHGANQAISRRIRAILQLAKRTRSDKAQRTSSPRVRVERRTSHMTRAESRGRRPRLRSKNYYLPNSLECRLLLDWLRRSIRTRSRRFRRRHEAESVDWNLDRAGHSVPAHTRHARDNSVIEWIPTPRRGSQFQQRSSTRGARTMATSRRTDSSTNRSNAKFVSSPPSAGSTTNSASRSSHGQR